jgi:peptidoglycan/xylan/chitin deacetylase (PgdA/CDA1 family)
VNHNYRLRYGPELLMAFLAILLRGNVAVAVDLPPSTNPPGGLAPSNTPQIVLLTFDDSVTIDSLSLVQQALTNHFNPNGGSIKATFFVSMDSSYDPYSIRQLYDAGHEIALHTMSHQTGTNSSLFRWRQEIAGEKRSLSELCGIPPDDITGFRAPYLAPNDSAFRVLSERQFRYDSNFPESLSGLSTAPSNMIWPYTLDHGLMQSAPPAYSPATNYPGLFEIPLWVQFTNMTEVTTMDPPETFTSNAVVELWKTNFLEHYNGNRAPYGIYLHATSTTHWLSNPTHSAWRIAALREFIDWALTQPDTWFITCNDLVDFMLEPVAAQDAVAHPTFQTPVRTPFPTSEVTRCSLGSHTFYACGPCPPAMPKYDNAYLGLALAPMDGGTLTFNILSQNVETVWYEMVVSNDTPHQVCDWSISFTLDGGYMLPLYDATMTQSGDQVSVSSRWDRANRVIDPFGASMIEFSIAITNAIDGVTLTPASVAVTGLGPQPIRINIEALTAPASWNLTWDDNAYVYSVECSTNLLDPEGWTVITNDIALPETEAPYASDDGSRFYRVKGTLFE